jgi:transposase
LQHTQFLQAEQATHKAFVRETSGLLAEHADVRERLQTQIAQLTQQLSEALLKSEPSRTLLAGAPVYVA